jgi:hypothetical protein
MARKERPSNDATGSAAGYALYETPPWFNIAEPKTRFIFDIPDDKTVVHGVQDELV